MHSVDYHFTGPPRLSLYQNTTKFQGIAFGITPELRLRPGLPRDLPLTASFTGLMPFYDIYEDYGFSGGAMTLCFPRYHKGSPFTMLPPMMLPRYFSAMGQTAESRQRRRRYFYFSSITAFALCHTLLR